MALKRTAMESPSRPQRRAAKKTIVVEEDSEEELSVVKEQDENDDDFTAIGRNDEAMRSRRQTSILATTQPRRRAGRPRKAPNTLSTEQSPTLVDENTSMMCDSESQSPKKTSSALSPKKRKAIVPRSRRSSIQPLTQMLPTPDPSVSPENTVLEAAPLVDITNKVINRRSKSPEKKTIKPVLADIPSLTERPMDIIVRARAEASAAPQIEVNTPSKARMVIRQLVMTNFKSYAGRQIVGPFHHSFSSVVGPNGSGKSNVIDSLLFVFGFRASKMRQGKISALIHNSATYPDLDFCEVEVHFQEVIDKPDGGCDVLPDSTTVVSRRAFKNNSSNYYLNGKTTNFTTVTTLLKDRGIDLDHKRFLILQGEVESIAQMKPKAANEHDDGLLEYLEDIIGTSKYKTPIEEVVVELEGLNEVCMEKQGRVQHVEKEKNALEDKKNKALAFVKQENELAEKQSALYQIYIAECFDNAQVTGEAMTDVQKQLDAELSTHNDSESAIKEMEKTYRKALKHFEAIEKQTQEFLQELAKHDKESVKFDEKRRFIVNKQKKAQKLVESSRFSGSESRSLVDKYLEDVERKSGQLSDLNENLEIQTAELDRVRESLKGKTQGLSDKIAQKQKSLEPWQEKISQKESSLAVARSELEILMERANAGQQSLVQADARIEKIATQQAEKVERQTELLEEKRKAEKQSRKIKDALEKLAFSEENVRSNVAVARQKAEEARSSLSMSQNQGNVLKGLLRLRDSGRTDGFHGRLGNLGTIDEKYDIAISTACPSLENMVVDSVETGQQCIEYLRKNNLGRANFILLDRLAKRDLSPIQTPENVPRLFDLVRSKDDRFLPAFYSIMQNTLVAQDLQQANRIAYGAKRWRVVTLDGQLIDVSGTMSGGGTKVARGAMSSKQISDVSKEQVEMLEAQRDEQETNFQAFQDKQRELIEALREKQDEIPQLEISQQKIQLEMGGLDKTLRDAKKQRDELALEIKSTVVDQSAISLVEKQMAVIQDQIEDLKQDTLGIEAEIEGLQQKIMDAGGIQLRTQKSRVDSLREQINLLNAEISAAEVAKSKNEKLMTRHDKVRKDVERELESLFKEFEQLESDIATQADDVKSSRERAELAKDELDTKKEELSEMKKVLDERNETLNRSHGLEIELRNKLEENQKILSDNTKKLKYWNEKLGKLTLHEIISLDVKIQNEPKEGQTQACEVGAYEAEVRDDLAMPTDPEKPEHSCPQTGECPEASEMVTYNKGTTSLPTYSRDELLDLNKDSILAQITALEEKISNTSNVDLTVIAEYQRRCQDLAMRTKDLNSALSIRDSAKNRLTDLRHLRLSQFMTGFTTISSHLKSMYQLITLGGNAELELVDSLDPFSEGILFSVMPPKKSWKNISNLSGGEKTLSSLALVFALHVYRPTPLYVMDEIDAALDFRNVSIIAGYIKERTKHAQFIVISLRNNMFELAERLIGIYKVNHMTKSVTVDNKDYIQR